MEQLKAYALRKHFFRVLNEQGVEAAYDYLLKHPPVIDKLSKAYQDSLDEAYIKQLSLLNEQKLLQSQNEISMLLMYAPWNLDLWSLFAQTYSEKKIHLKQDILWFVAIKRNNRQGWIQFTKVVRGARQWNLEAMYGHLKLIELSKFKHHHIQQIEFLAQKTYFDLEYLSQYPDKIRRISELFSKIIKKPECQELLVSDSYFCSFCYLFLGDTQKAVQCISLTKSKPHQCLMVNQLLYYDYVREAKGLLKELIKNEVITDQALIAYYQAQISAYEQGEEFVKPVMLLLKLYPITVPASTIEAIGGLLENHPNPLLVSECLKWLSRMFQEDFAIAQLYAKSLARLVDVKQSFSEQVKLFNESKTEKTVMENGMQLIVFSYQYAMEEELEFVFQTCLATTQMPRYIKELITISELLKQLKTEGIELFETFLDAYHRRDYEVILALLEQEQTDVVYQCMIELNLLPYKADFLAHFMPWLLVETQEKQNLIGYLPKQEVVLEKLIASKLTEKQLLNLTEADFIKQKLVLFLRQLLPLEEFTLYLEILALIYPRERVVHNVLHALAQYKQKYSYSIRYPLLNFLANWYPTEKLTLMLARCCYRLKKYEEASCYYEQCKGLIDNRFELEIEAYISMLLAHYEELKVSEQVRTYEVIRYSILQFMSDRQFIKQRTEIYMYYLKNHCEIELLTWWYQMYRRIYKYDEALKVIDQFSRHDLGIYRNVLKHFEYKLQKKQDSQLNDLIDGVKTRLNILEETGHPMKVAEVFVFNPGDLKTLQELMYEHDVIRHLPHQHQPFFETEILIEYAPKNLEKLSWFGVIKEKVSGVYLFSKS